MPVSFQQLVSDSASATLETNLGPVTIDYYPNKLTGQMIADIKSGNMDDDKILLDLIKSWDLMDTSVDPPVMFPLSRINELGVFFKEKIAQAIMRDMRPETVAPQTQQS